MLKITILSFGQKMPAWVLTACHDMQKRLAGKINLEWIDLPLVKRGSNQQLTQVLDKEYQCLMAQLPAKAHVVALDPEGKLSSSKALAQRIAQIQQVNSHLCLVIGGPEGLHPKFKAMVDEKWSLSPLTFSHPLVRLVILETIFRSWCIMNNHPFHK